MPSRKQKVWVWLTWQQIDALLAAAKVIDRTPEALEAVLPTAGERAAFRGAIAALKDVRGAPGKGDT
jgi:hypothetical protein